jgi:HTH-type transcriptional regulator/antitoxin HigA
MPALNAGKYAAVVTGYGFAPKVIETEKDYRQAKEVLEKLLLAERALPAEEDALAKLLLHLVDAYETRTVVTPQSSPREMLMHLMEQRELRQADLVGVVGTASVVSEVLSGKRSINARQARRLAEFFGVSADLFV